MIRRDTSSGPDASWILISQIDHAHLAARLAEHWGLDPLAPLWPRQEVLWAVAHHDDGWAAWDEAPGIDPASGQPRSFIEMEVSNSLAIWTRSIENARLAGPLPSYLVAGHFCVLARRAMAWKHEPSDRILADQFLAQYEALMGQWLATWQQSNPTENTTQRAAVALAHLQFFDFLSLWFCCSAASDPDEVEPPGGSLVTLTPLDVQRVCFSPWPWVEPSLNLEVQGRLVPAQRYADPADLASVPIQSVRLDWQLQRTAAKS